MAGAAALLVVVRVAVNPHQKRLWVHGPKLLKTRCCQLSGVDYLPKDFTMRYISASARSHAQSRLRVRTDGCTEREPCVDSSTSCALAKWYSDRLPYSATLYQGLTAGDTEGL